MSSGTGRPAISKNVSAKSRFETSDSQTEPGLVTPGQRTSRGMRYDSSYMNRLSNQPCSPKIKTLVGRVDDDRVLGQAALVEVIEQAADVLIHGRHATQVILDVPLVLPMGQFLAGEVGFAERPILRLIGGRPFGELLGVQILRRDRVSGRAC